MVWGEGKVLRVLLNQRLDTWEHGSAVFYYQSKETWNGGWEAGDFTHHHQWEARDLCTHERCLPFQLGGDMECGMRGPDFHHHHQWQARHQLVHEHCVPLPRQIDKERGMRGRGLPSSSERRRTPACMGALFSITTARRHGKGDDKPVTSIILIEWLDTCMHGKTVFHYHGKGTWNRGLPAVEFHYFQCKAGHLHIHDVELFMLYLYNCELNLYLTYTWVGGMLIRCLNSNQLNNPRIT